MADKEPQVPQRKDSAEKIKSYYTKDINDAIAGMSMNQMKMMLKELAEMPHWIAVLKYSSARIPFLDSILRSTSPIADPGKISWAQGAMAGVCDLENFVIDEVLAPKKPDTDASIETGIGNG